MSLIEPVLAAWHKASQLQALESYPELRMAARPLRALVPRVGHTSDRPTRGIPRPIAIAMGDWDPTSVSYETAMLDSSDTVRVRDLMARAMARIMNTVSSLTQFEPMDAAASADILGMLDDCALILEDVVVRAALGSDAERMDALVVRSRTIADAFGQFRDAASANEW